MIINHCDQRTSKVVYVYHVEGGFKPLDCYISTSLKPAPRTLQAHPRSLLNLNFNHLSKKYSQNPYENKKPTFMFNLIVEI